MGCWNTGYDKRPASGRGRSLTTRGGGVRFSARGAAAGRAAAGPPGEGVATGGGGR
ncbi:Uncharacterized protein ToN1_14410 [Aromatoleum petrolei]|nr:Uncharacterized protein ToN1_14410 [Aromatoleum petrolei]